MERGRRGNRRVQLSFRGATAEARMAYLCKCLGHGNHGTKAEGGDVAGVHEGPQQLVG